MSSEKKNRLYRVHCSRRPNPQGHGWRDNVVYYVATTSVLRAAALCEEAHPDCSIWNVVHLGPVDHIDPELSGKTSLHQPGAFAS